jgi:hypothetical protein
MAQMGFKRKGVVFHRRASEKIINLLSTNKYSSKNEYSIQFDIYPLCDGSEIDTFMDTTTISDLFRFNTWTYSGDENDKTMATALNICRQFLFPYFNRITDYSSYLNYIVERVGERRYKYIRMRYDYYMINLALGNYQEAIISRDVYFDWYKDKSNPDNHYWVEQRKIMRNEYELIRDAIQANDEEYIRQYVKAKEDYSLSSYQENFKLKIP